jgi:hypothetical protein
MHREPRQERIGKMLSSPAQIEHDIRIIAAARCRVVESNMQRTRNVPKRMPGSFFTSQGEGSPYAEVLSSQPVVTAKHRIR